MESGSSDTYCSVEHPGTAERTKSGRSSLRQHCKTLESKWSWSCRDSQGVDSPVCKWGMTTKGCYLCNNSHSSITIEYHLLESKLQCFAIGGKNDRTITVRIMLCTCVCLQCSKHQSRCCLVWFNLLFSGSCPLLYLDGFDFCFFTIPVVSPWALLEPFLFAL